MKRIEFPHKIHLMNTYVNGLSPLYLDVKMFGKRHEVVCHQKLAHMFFNDVAMTFVITRRFYKIERL